MRLPFSLTALPVLIAMGAHADTLYLEGFGNLPGQGGQAYEVYAIDTTTGDVLNGWRAINAADTSAVYGGETALAVDTTIRTVGMGLRAPEFYPQPTMGSQYTLGGAYTGVTYTNPLAYPGEVLDATTDGAHNYFVDASSGIVYQTNLDYTNPVALFAAPGGGIWEGISYDPRNNSLWLSQGPNSPVTNDLVADFSLSGNLLGSFHTGHDNNDALAFDPLDGTLWLNNTVGSIFAPVADRLEQYSTSGVLLNTISEPFTSPGYPPIFNVGEIYSAEFSEVPVLEPSGWSVLLLNIGIILIAGWKVSRKMSWLKG